MTGDHYFTAQPASADDRRTVSVRLRGHDLAVQVASGVFSPGHVDLGTSVLLKAAPEPPPGDLLDLGCGWGPLTLAMALDQPDARVWAVDVNERALDLTRRNAAAAGVGDRVMAVTPEHVPGDLTFAAAWSNPPIRVGKESLHKLLATWLPRLAPEAEAHLVVQRHLGADSLARWLAEQRDAVGSPWGEVEKVRSAKGFRVLRFTRAAGAGA